MAKHMQATDNHVFDKEKDLVGKGATCEVFKGIHKSSGEVHALKIFDSRLRSIAEREIEALRALKHENIVDFLGHEQEFDTGRQVAVMEYCEKSLWNNLCEPENTYGLPEDEYLRFFQHIVEGMKHLREHGFLHRDIKPGNILLAQDENGSIIYKLSDFGTAKPVLETEAFQSLVGTEEYLHPNIFRAAFIDKEISRDFDAAADLWSLGATLYHAATGKVPFMPYNGRNDRALMFQMIAKKEYGVIAGEQHTFRGEIIWKRELPSTCQMSRWLKTTLTEVLARLLEADPRKAMTFETFFLAADDILRRRVIYIFSTTSAKHTRLYLEPTCVYSDLQQEINAETNIPHKDQIIYYEECLLQDVVKEHAPVTDYPRMSSQVPLVLIRATGLETCIMPEEAKKLWYNQSMFEFDPVFDESFKHLDEDYRTAREICDQIAVIQQRIQISCLTQDLFEKTINRTERWKEVLIKYLETEVDLYRSRVKDLRHIHAAIMQNGGIQCLAPADGVTIEDLKYRTGNCQSYLRTIKESNIDDGALLYQNGCQQGNQCQKKIARLLDQAKDRKTKFESRKKFKRLPFNEEQLHKFDRKTILMLLEKSKDLWNNHCQQTVAKLHAHFLKWHKTFAELQTHMERLQREIKDTKSSIKRYMRNFKVGTQPESMSSEHGSMPSVDGLKVDMGNRDLASAMFNKLEQVRSSQQEIQSLIDESKQLNTQSLSLMTEDLKVITLS